MKDIGVLRNIAVDEVQLILAWRNAPSVRANMYTQHKISLEEHLRWWERIQAAEDQRYLMYEIARRPCGVVAFNRIDRASQNAFWAFYAAPDAAMGVGAKMEFLAIEHAFSDLLLHKLQCEVLAFNATVIKLHTKFGFKPEGVFKAQQKVADGFVDVHRLGLLRSEWQELQPKMAAKIKALN